MVDEQNVHNKSVQEVKTQAAWQQVLMEKERTL
jgi:hypothetical protein